MAEQVMHKHLQADILKAAVVERNAINMDVAVHELIDSTNSWSLQQAKIGRDLPFACFAEQQTQGRGRRGKHWIMTANANIAMTVVWPFSVTCQQLHLLPMSIALAIVETLESYQLKNVQIKWPNDVYVSGKKIAGVLIETRPVNKAQVAVIIGIGLNYDMDDDLLALLRNGVKNLLDFTDVCTEAESQLIKSLPDRNGVAVTLLQNVVSICQQFQYESKNYLEQFRHKYDYCKAKNVEIRLDNDETLTGIAQGVSNDAELIVLVDGKKCVFNSAEVSVKAKLDI